MFVGTINTKKRNKNNIIMLIIETAMFKFKYVLRAIPKLAQMHIVAIITKIYAKYEIKISPLLPLTSFLDFIILSKLEHFSSAITNDAIE